MRTTTLTLTLMFAMAIAGTALQAERLSSGLEFNTPKDWTVKANDAAALLTPPDMVMEANGKDPSELYLVLQLPGLQSPQDPQLVSSVQKYFPANANVHVAGAPQGFRAVGGQGMIYRYDAVSEGVALNMRIYAVGLPGGGVAGVLAIARPMLMVLRETALSSVAMSLTRQAGVASPGGALATQWDQKLRGRKLYQFSAYSSSYGSGGMNSQKSLLLGVNGMYEFRRSSSVSIDVPGASGGSASRNGAQGRWRIYEQGGNVVLELAPSSGAAETIVLTANGSKTLLNGQRWLVGD